MKKLVALLATTLATSFTLTLTAATQAAAAWDGVFSASSQGASESISINFHSGSELSGNGSAMIGLAGYQVSKDGWNSLVATNNASLMQLKGVRSGGGVTEYTDMSVTITGTRGHWNCSKLSSADNILHGYIDDHDSFMTPTVTVTGVPYEKYRVVVYHSTDTANIPFGYDLVNGIPFTGVSGHTVIGTALWGNSGPKDSANSLEEGVNVLVSSILPNNAEKKLTVIGHRVSGSVARGCIAAIQIFDASEKNVDLEIVSNRFETVLSPGEGGWRFPDDGVVADHSGFGGVVVGTNGISHAFASTEGYANTAISVLAAIPETTSGTLVALGVKGNNDVQAKYNGNGTFLLTYNGTAAGGTYTVTSRKVDVSGVHAYTLRYSKNDGTVLYQDGVAIAIADRIKWKDNNAISSVEFGMRHGGGDVLTGLTAYAAYTHYWSTDVNSASKLFDTFDHSVFRDGNASLAKKAEVFTHLVGYGDTEGLLALMPHRTSTYEYGGWHCPLDAEFADGDYVSGLKIAAEPVTYDLLDVTTNALSASVLAKITDTTKEGTLVSFFVNNGARIDAVYNGDGKCYIRWGDGTGYARAWTDVLDVSGVHVWSLVYRNDGEDGTALYCDGVCVASDSVLHWSGSNGRVKGHICFGVAANGARPMQGLEIYAVHTDFGADATFFSEAGINSAAVFDTFDFMPEFSDDTIAEKLVAFEYYAETGLVYDPSPVVTTDTVLHISEICPKPTARDPNGVEAGWIEIHNTSDTFAANLSDYSLTTANRGGEIKAAAALPDVTIPAGGYKIVYTTKEYPKEGINDGSTPFITNEAIVAQLKINPKKYPIVQLRKGKAVVDSFIIPVDLPDNTSFAPAGGIWGDYSGAMVEPVEEETVEPAEEVEISDSMLTVSSSVSKNETEGFYSFANVTNGKEGILIDKSATELMAEKDMYSISLTFRLTNNTAQSESTGMPLFFCRNSNTSAPYSGILAYINKAPYGNIIIQIRDAGKSNRDYQVDSDINWLDGEWHTLEVSCGQTGSSRIAVSVDGVKYVDTTCGVAATLNTNMPMCIGRAYDSSSWTAFTGDIKDIHLYSGDAFPAPLPDPAEETSDKTEIVDATAVTRVILPTITPGAANKRAGEIAYGPNAGPLYGIKHKVSDWKAWAQAKVGEDYSVALALNPMDDDPTNAIQSVSLAYRTDFSSIGFVTMEKGECVENEGQLWTATIPGSAITQAGHILRWAAVATDAAGNKWRTPSFCDPDNAYEWYGTLIEPPEGLLSEKLQTFHIFADATAQANMDKQYDSIAGSMPYGARVQIYDSQTGFYYDNVRIDLRGNTTAGFRKKSHGIRFIKSQPLTCTNPFTGELIDGLRKVSFIAEYSDPSFIRQALAFQLFKDMGLNVPYSYPVRLNMNGQFFQMAFHSNRFSDELIEDYYGLDPLGYSYKSVGTLRGATSAGGTEKKTPDDGNDRDLSVLSAFYSTFSAADKINESFEGDGMASEIPAVTKTVVKKFDLPAWLNYLAAARITQECDDVWANLCAYYDVNGTDTWMPLGYDFNVSLGAIYLDDSNYKTYKYPIDQTMANVDNFKSHPFYGGNRVRCHKYNSSSTINSGNRGFEAVWQSPKFRRLYLRRLRTVMDEQLKAPGTTKEDTPFWSDYVVAYTNAIAVDAALDRAKWGYGNGTSIYWWPNALNLEEGIADLWDNYVVPRREHLFVTHSVNNTEKTLGYGKDFNAGIPDAQSPIVDLKAGFSVDNTTDETKTAIDDAEKIVIRNANAEAVDMSGWRLTGRFNMTLPAGTVVDSNDTITVVVDRKAYIAAHDAELTNQVIVGNAGLVSETMSQKLYDAHGAEVLKVELPSEESRYLRFFAFDGVPVGDDVNEWVILTNINDTITLDLEGINVLIGSSVEKAKCRITLGAGTLAPGASLKLEQESYSTNGWEKITNGELVLQITDANGTVGHSGSGVVQKDFDGYKSAKKYLQLTQFGPTFTGADLIIVDYPVTTVEVVPGEDVALEAATQEEEDAALADCEIVLSAEDKTAGLVTNVLKLVAVPVVSVDPQTSGATTTYVARVEVDETKVDPPTLGQIEEGETTVDPLTVESDEEGSKVTVGVSNARVGLWYGFIWTDSLGDKPFENDVESFKLATSTSVKIESKAEAAKSAQKAFFRVKVSATKP